MTAVNLTKFSKSKEKAILRRNAAHRIFYSRNATSLTIHNHGFICNFCYFKDRTGGDDNAGDNILNVLRLRS